MELSSPDSAARAPGSKKAFAIWVLVCCNVLWGLSFTLTDITNQIIGNAAASGSYARKVANGSFYVAVRFLVAFAFLFVTRRTLFREQTRETWKEGLRIGILFGVAMLLQSMGLYEIFPSRSAFLTSLSIIFTPILLIFIGRRGPPLVMLLACLIAMAGSAVLTEMYDLSNHTFGNRNTLEVGDVLTIIASLLFSWCIIEIDRASAKFDPRLLTPGMFLSICAVGIPGTIIAATQRQTATTSMLSGYANLFQSPVFWAMLLLLSFFCTLFPFHLMNKYQQYLSPTHAALIYTLEPIFASFWSMFLPERINPFIGGNFINETIKLPTYIGGALILVANIVVLLPDAPAWLKRRAELTP